MVTIAERANDRQEALELMMEGMQSGMWTALPGTIVSYNAAAGTVQVQPTIQSTVTLPDGTSRQQSLPVLADVPVVFPGGGGATLTFPITAGDECLVVFSSRPIDGWWQGGGQAPSIMPRMHDLSDGFALVGVRNRGRALPGASTNSVTLRTDNGATHVELVPGTNKVNVVAQEATVTAPQIKLNGLVTITGGLVVDGITFGTHKHTGVTPGGGRSAGPTN